MDRVTTQVANLELDMNSPASVGVCVCVHSCLKAFCVCAQGLYAALPVCIPADRQRVQELLGGAATETEVFAAHHPLDFMAQDLLR